MVHTRKQPWIIERLLGISLVALQEKKRKKKEKILYQLEMLTINTIVYNKEP